MTTRTSQGLGGWDEYAPFYDWENAQTLGRRDVAFWCRSAKAVRGPVLELGCGTGRISLPLARAGVRLVGIDRSEAMLGRAAERARACSRPRRGAEKLRLGLVRGDIRSLPFADGRFGMVLAPYGILQSLLRDRDLNATLDSVAGSCGPAACSASTWCRTCRSGRNTPTGSRCGARPPAGAHLTLVESVPQDRRRRLTIFEQEYRVEAGPTGDRCIRSP